MHSMSDKPVQAAQVVAVGGGAQAVDAVAFSNLANVTNIKLKQGNVFWEAVSGGCAANTYMVTTRDVNNPEAEGIPIFIMQEESSCWCRCCCNGCQPLYVKFYNVADGGVVPASGCLCCRKPEHKRYMKAGSAVMTLERPGFSDKCFGCGPGGMFVCTECCQSETYLHAGDVGAADGSDVNKIDRSTAFGHSFVPIGGGGCTPTVNLMSRDAAGNETPLGVVEGPTCFGGCMDLCVNTNFFVSKEKGKAGDIAIIQKKARDPGFMGFCIALCTVVDTYNLDFTDPNLTPQQKAQVIGDAIHLDYLFFDQEQPLCRYNESNNTIEILLCLCYCFGCLCPIKLCIPTSNGGDGGGDDGGD